MNKITIYLLDDDEVSGAVLKHQLGIKGINCCYSKTSEQLFNLLKKENKPSLFILDHSLIGEKISGLDVCRHLKAIYKIPVVMLTGDRTTPTIVGSIAVGADLYIEKPYEFDQFFAKISAIIRIYAQLGDAAKKAYRGISSVLGVTVSSSKRDLKSDKGDVVSLTEKEMAFYEIICGQENYFISREDAYLGLYGRPMEVMNRAIDNLACRLRRKLKNLNVPVELQVIRGIGYQLVSNK